jgi:hypothetical protein
MMKKINIIFGESQESNDTDTGKRSSYDYSLHSLSNAHFQKNIHNKGKAESCRNLQVQSFIIHTSLKTFEAYEGILLSGN